MSSKIFAALGVADFKTYMLKYFLPIFALDLVMLFIFLISFETLLLQAMGGIIFFLVLILLFSYPSILVDNQSKNIDENIHFFITYAGALSTVNLERKELFKDLSNKVKYREIAKIFGKLIYLVESIKVDFSTSAYKVSSLLKSEHFARFLERMGIALSFNSDISKFFLEEQKVLMNSYETVYKESIERIKVVQSMFVSLILAFAFVLATILLIPFITGIQGSVFLLYGIIGLVIIDFVMIAFISFFLPKDKLHHNMGFDEGRQKIVFLFIITGFISLLLTPVVLITDFAFMLKAAIISTPLLVTGIYANYQEKLVWKRDTLFPAFVRSLGDVHQSKGGTLTTTVETLLPHNFGILNNMLERVYKRLTITADKFNSWYYFTKESGSLLIAEFMDIFVTVVYRGGSAQVAGEIVSDNMSRINDLRDQKKELSSSLKTSVYGSFFGLAITLYISLLISMLLLNIFTSLTSGLEGMALDLLSGIFPMDDNASLDFETSFLYVGIMLTIHAFMSGFMSKLIDGGDKFSMFTDVVIMLWMGAIIEISMTFLFENMFSNFFGA